MTVPRRYAPTGARVRNRCAHKNEIHARQKAKRPMRASEIGARNKTKSLRAFTEIRNHENRTYTSQKLARAFLLIV